MNLPKNLRFPKNLPISVLLLTLNEETNLSRCLAALTWCDDVVVLDSFSDDGTTGLAASLGCRVFQRKFDDFAGQRNHGLKKIEFKHEWVLHLDADEVVTPALVEEMGKNIQNPDFDAFRMAGKMIFQGRWLRYSGMYPSYQVRLTRKNAFQFKQVGHGQKEDISPDRIGNLAEAYLHYSFSKGLSDWFDRHNRYSTAEAEASLRSRENGSLRWSELLSKDPYKRQQVLRRLSLLFPLKPLIRFVYMFFVCRGFMDGMAGLTYCRMVAVYETMIELKRWEMEREFKSFLEEEK